MQEPGYSAPIPPPTGGPIGGPGGVIPPSGSARVNFDVIGRAWESLKPNIGVWIAAFLIYAVVLGILSSLVGALMGASAQPVPVPGPNGVPTVQLNYPMIFISQLIQFIIGQFFIGGMYRMAINQVRTGQANIGDMFSVADVLPNLLIAAILTSLATFVGFLFCVIPGLLISGILMFAIPLVVDARMGAIDAISTSWNTLKDQALMAFVFMFVISLLAIAGLALCLVGVFITGPLAVLSLATLYRDFFPQHSAQNPHAQLV